MLLGRRKRLRYSDLPQQERVTSDSFSKGLNPWAVRVDNWGVNSGNRVVCVMATLAGVHPLGIVPPSPRIARAYAVHCGPHAAVSRLARQRGCCRQWLYREAASATAATAGTAHPAERQRLRQRLRELEQQLQALQRRLGQAVVLDTDKQAEFATVG